MKNGKEIDDSKTLHSTLDNPVSSDNDLEEVNIFFQQRNTKYLYLKPIAILEVPIRSD